MKVWDICRDHVKFIVHNVKYIRFWLDWWHGAAPMCSSVPLLFSFCGHPDITIFELASSGWDLAFRRSLSPKELDTWHQLAATFPLLSESPDCVVWPHSPSGIFLVKSLYQKLISGTASSKFKDVCLEGSCPSQNQDFSLAGHSGQATYCRSD